MSNRFKGICIVKVLKEDEADVMGLYFQVIMFLSKSDEEGSANRKLARDLVDKWVSVCVNLYLTLMVYYACLLRSMCHINDVIAQKKLDTV